MATRVYEGVVGDWCDGCESCNGCQSQYIDDGREAAAQEGPTDEGWFKGLNGRRVRVTIEVLE